MEFCFVLDSCVVDLPLQNAGLLSHIFMPQISLKFSISFIFLRWPSSFKEDVFGCSFYLTGATVKWPHSHTRWCKQTCYCLMFTAAILDSPEPPSLSIFHVCLAKLILYCLRNEYDRKFSINFKNHLTVFMRSYIVSLGTVQGTIQWHLLLLGWLTKPHQH